MDKKNICLHDPVSEEIKGYTDPQIAIGGRENYVYFYAFDPVSGRRKRKKYMLDHCRSKAEMKRKAHEMVKLISRKIEGGWNPWIEKSGSLSVVPFLKVADLYHDFLYKRLRDGSLREDTIVSYLSYLKVLKEWVGMKKSILYIFQLDHQMITDFLDYVYVERNNSYITRNNYLSWLKSFCGYLLERGYLKEDPSARFSNIKKRGHLKERTVIPDHVMLQIRNYLQTHNRHFLLACYLTHYMCIRPKELSRMYVGDINIGANTITLHSDQTKNRDSVTITMPQKVARLMIELDLFSAHGGCYLFSDGFKPGEKPKSEKQFRDYWMKHVRKDLGFPAAYKYYSLKDTGITNMLRNGIDPISVRDQARHSSLAVTNTYTPLELKAANPLMLKYEGVF